MKPSDFLTALWGDKPVGRIQLWRLADKKAFYPISTAAADYYIGAEDMFTCVTLTFPKRAATAAGRPLAAHGIALAGMWLDIDVLGGPKPNTTGVPTKDDALALASSVLEPTILIDSGYGIHAYHLFDAVWAFRTKDDQADATALAAQWYALHAREASQRGWYLDQGTRDLARLLRLPGTINAKGDARAPVDALGTTGPRYVLDDIRATAATVGPISNLPASLPGMGSDGGEILVDVPGALAPGTLDVLLDDLDFAAAWAHARTIGDGSMSAYDMSLASQLCHAGTWTDQQIADVIAAHRLHHDPADRKHLRIGYLRATIGRARAGHDTEAPRDVLRSLRTDAREAA